MNGMDAMRDFFGLEGKTALVIGGGLGMGEATSLTLAQAGCDVAVGDIDRARAEGVADKVRALGRKATVVVSDVMDTAGATKAIEQVEADLGRIDVMATIVGQAEWAKVLDVSEEIWDLDHRRNLRYFFFYAQAAARAMVRAGHGGAITAVASVSGIQSAPNHAAYGAAKAGLINLVRTMGVELAEKGIRVNAVAPGTIRTPRLTEGRSAEEAAAWDRKIRDSLIPFGRLGETQEIANAILFLCSDLATYITGQTLAVDGGFTAQFLLGNPRD